MRTTDHSTPKFEVAFANGYSGLHIHSPTLFQARHQRLCHDIIEALRRLSIVGSAHFDPVAATLDLDFIPNTDTPDRLANSVAKAIRTGLSTWKKRQLNDKSRSKAPLTGHGASGAPDHTSACTTPGFPHPASPTGRGRAGVRSAICTVTERTHRTGQSIGGLQQRPVVEQGRRRIWLLFKAAASFVMTIIGMIVPGIPTLPFLLLTSYYLARSSPWLHAKLMRTHFIGDILRDWEQNYALSRASKKKLLQLLFVVTVLTLLILPKTPISLILIALSVLLSLYGIQSLPDDRESAITPALALEPAV
jgi:uncharacterized membrane protein YbaN (DUF454 family)